MPGRDDLLGMNLEFPLGENEVRLRTEVWDFARRVLMPLAEKADRNDEPDEDVTRAIRGAGLFRNFLPQEYGGTGVSVTKLCVIREALAYACVASDEFFASQGVAVQPIVMFGTTEQKRKYVDGLLTGSRLYAFCLTEPVAGSDIRGIRTTARKTDRGFLLNGTKRFVFRGNEADTLIVFAKLGPAEERGSLTGFLFDRPAKGLSVRPFPLMFPAPEFEVCLQDCFVPDEGILGEPGKGAHVALSNLDRLRPSVGAAAVGMGQRALDSVLEYVRSRRAFDRRLADFQGVQFKLAESATELAAARLMVYAAARRADEAPPGIDVRVSSAAAKLFATETAQRVIDSALQFHGGVGLVRGSVTERLYKAIRATRIYEGASEIMKLVIGGAITGDRGSRV